MTREKVVKMLFPVMAAEVRKKIEEAYEIAIFMKEPMVLNNALKNVAEEYREEIENLSLEYEEEVDVEKEDALKDEECSEFFEQLEEKERSLKHAPGQISRNIVSQQGSSRKRKRPPVPPSRYPYPEEHSKTSRYVGVYRDRRGKYKAKLGIKGKTLNLGRFDTEEEAARAYDTMKYRHTRSTFGLNFPEEYHK